MLSWLILMLRLFPIWPPEALSGWPPCPPDLPIILQVRPCFQLAQVVPGLSFSFPTPPWMNHFSKKLWRIFKNQAMDTRNAHGYWGVLFLRLSADRSKKYIPVHRALPSLHIGITLSQWDSGLSRILLYLLICLTPLYTENILRITTPDHYQLSEVQSFFVVLFARLHNRRCIVNELCPQVTWVYFSFLWVIDYMVSFMYLLPYVFNFKFFPPAHHCFLKY